MKIGVYTIALNEEKFAERWAKSAQDADYLLVADTGSTDRTVEILKENNVNVFDIRIKPWRFDRARDASMVLLPSDLDVIIALDMDEILLPGWRKLIEDHWTPETTRLRYNYTWNWMDKEETIPDKTYYGDKITSRWNYRWKAPVHETARCEIQELQTFCHHTLIEHHPDNSKSRGQYFSLLEKAVSEEPFDDRNSSYLTREYMFYERYNEAINEGLRYLTLPSALWKAERAATMSYIAKSYVGLGNMIEAESWFSKSIFEDPSSREAIMNMCAFQLSQTNWLALVYYAEKALNLPVDNTSYLTSRYASQEGPWDYLSIGYFYLDMKEKALVCAKKALEFNPNDERLQNNLKLILQ